MSDGVPNIPLTSMDDKERAIRQGRKARERALKLHGIGWETEDPYEHLEGLRQGETIGGPLDPNGPLQGAQSQAVARDAMAQLARGAGGPQTAAAMHAMRRSTSAQNAQAQAQARAQAQSQGGGNPAAQLAALRGLYRGTGAAAAQSEDEAKRRQMMAQRQAAQIAGARRRHGFAESRHRTGQTNERRMGNWEHQRGVAQRRVDQHLDDSRRRAAVNVGQAQSAEHAADRQAEENSNLVGGLIQLFGSM